MTRPEDIQKRIANIRQIEIVVTTLQALASSHQVEARKHLDAIRTHEATVSGALSVALSALTEPPETGSSPGPHLSIVVGATQGFCGAYAERLATTAKSELEWGARLMVIGARTISSVETEPALVWTSDMVTHASEIPALASRLGDALFAELAQNPGSAVRIFFADPADASLAPASRSLVPFDFSRFPRAPGHEPLMTLAPRNLVGALVEEYIFTEICEALMLGFAAENAARAAAMARAKSNIRDRIEDLTRDFRSARQEHMTTEIIEATAGAVAAH